MNEEYDENEDIEEELVELVNEVVKGEKDHLEEECDDGGSVAKFYLDEAIKDNIKCLFRLSGLWRKDMSISLSEVSRKCDNVYSVCLLTHEFKVYADNGNVILGYGTAISKYDDYQTLDYFDLRGTKIIVPAIWVRNIYQYVHRNRKKRMIPA